MKILLKYTFTALIFSFTVFLIKPLSAQTIKVFVLAGQSNAQGHGDINPVTTSGTLSHFIQNDLSNEFNNIHDGNGNWVAREDVLVRYDHEFEGLLSGNLNVGFGSSAVQIGPELGMGHALGDHLEDKVLIIKTCWGGKNLAVDFRPPSSGGQVGTYYTQMISDINTTINNISTEFPDYNGESLELAGFVWFQGWNDGEEDSYLNEYEQNLINLINDVRSDLNTPDLPFVVGLTGNGGYTISQNDLWIQNLQTILVPAQIDATEFSGHQYVKYAETRDFWREPDLSPEEAVHHWNNNAESYLRIGNEFGLKLIELLDEIVLNVHPGQEISFPVISPSPAYDYISFSNYNEILHAEIYNLTGKQLMSFSIQSGQKIDISMLPAGMYCIRLIHHSTGQSLIQKFIKK